MKTYHHGDLRAAIIQRSIDVIGDSGVEGLSLRQIAKSLGVSHAAPARHFSSKADLLTAIVDQSYRELTDTILNALSDIEKGQAVQRLNRMAYAAILWAIENPARFTVMTNPDVSRYADDSLKEALRTFAGTIAEALSAAQAQGFRPQASPASLLVYAVGAVQGASSALTDGLIQDILGTRPDEALAQEIANQIAPI